VWVRPKLKQEIFFFLIKCLGELLSGTHRLGWTLRFSDPFFVNVLIDYSSKGLYVLVRFRFYNLKHVLKFQINYRI